MNWNVITVELYCNKLLVFCEHLTLVYETELLITFHQLNCNILIICVQLNLHQYLHFQGERSHSINRKSLLRQAEATAESNSWFILSTLSSKKLHNSNNIKNNTKSTSNIITNNKHNSTSTHQTFISNNRSSTLISSSMNLSNSSNFSLSRGKNWRRTRKLKTKSTFSVGIFIK